MAVKPDSFTSWIVVISVSIILSSSVWTYRCSSVLFIAIYENFETSRMEASWPFTVFFASSCCLGPFLGTLTQRFRIQTLFVLATCFNTLAAILSSFARNVWELTLTMGLLMGCSAGIPVMLSGLFVTKYFNKHRTIAMGAYLAGPSISSIVLPAIMQSCFEKYEFSGTVLIFACLTMQGIPASLFLRTIGEPERIQHSRSQPPTVEVPPVEWSSQDSMNAHPTEIRVPIVALCQVNGDRVCRDNPQSSTDNSPSGMRSSLSSLSIHSVIKEKAKAFQLFRKKWFYITALAQIVFILDMSTLLSVMEDFGRDKNVEPSLARNLVGVFASTDLLARLGSAWLTDGGFITRERLFMLNFFLIAACQYILGLTDKPVVLLCLLAVLGWLFGSTVILFIDIMRERLGLQYLPFACGWISFAGGVLSLGRPAAIGYFREQIGSYNPVMFLLSGSLATAFCVYLIGFLLECEKSDNTLGVIQEDRTLEKTHEFTKVRSVTSSLSSV